MADAAEPVLVDATVLDTAGFALIAGHDLTIGRCESAASTVSLDGARGWIRRLAAPDWRRAISAGSQDEAERKAYLTLTVGIASHPGVKWLTPYPNLVAAENKLRQAAHAHRLGIRIPRSAVVSDPEQIPHGLGDRIIVKPLGPGHFVTEDGATRVMWAEAMRRDDPRLAALDGAPFLLQEKIAAVRHLRVVTCGARAWTCELDAAGLPADWRRNDVAHHSFRATREHELETAALALAGDLGVGYSSQDWLDDRAGSPCFIDLNPAGQWLFLPEPVSTAVTATIAAHLTDDCP